MRLEGLVVRGFRNLAPAEVVVPPEGIALLGANAQGKTNFLEAVYYPVLFRSFRGAKDGEVAAFDGPGFRVESTVRHHGAARDIAADFRTGPRRKRITIDGTEPDRLADAVGQWIAVAFLPSDVGLASGPAGERRRYLDRLLSLADRQYLRTLTRYRAVVSQRNAALRQGTKSVAQAFDGALAAAGATLLSARFEWAKQARAAFAREFEALGGAAAADLEYRGRPELTNPEAWPAALAAAWASDMGRRVTTVGPHRDDLALTVSGRGLRGYGSTGQQRTAAVALKLLEVETLTRAHGFEPVLVLDDVFAELDAARQQALVGRLDAAREVQVFVTAPRDDELPAELALPKWTMREGRLACHD